MKVAAIIFLFLIRLRFRHSKSLSQIIRRRYGDKIVKRLRKFEKIDYRLRKAELDLEFLVKCRDNNVIPKSLNFGLANRTLRFSLTYAHCQSNLLLEKIRLKKSNVRVLKKEFGNLRSSLQQQINSIDFAHIFSIRLLSAFFFFMSRWKQNITKMCYNRLQSAKETQTDTIQNVERRVKLRRS